MSDAEWSVAGKVCLVTGSNTGIGRQTARELARLGAHVFFACRSEQKTRPVMEAISKETGNDKLEFLALDLASLGSVRQAAADLLARQLPLHLLVNNAGLAGHRGLTTDGFEIQFGVNYLGPFLFTKLLLDRIKESAPARIVMVSSRSHYNAKSIPYEHLTRTTRSITGMKEYGVSKAANVLHSLELSKRLEGSGVTTYSLHPGVIASDVWRRIPWPFRSLIKLRMKSEAEGAKTTLYCATDPGVGAETALFCDECKPRYSSRFTQDPAVAAELWQRSEQMIAAVSRAYCAGGNSLRPSA